MDFDVEDEGAARELFTMRPADGMIVQNNDRIGLASGNTARNTGQSLAPFLVGTVKRE